MENVYTIKVTITFSCFLCLGRIFPTSVVMVFKHCNTVTVTLVTLLAIDDAIPVSSKLLIFSQLFD